MYAVRVIPGNHGKFESLIKFWCFGMIGWFTEIIQIQIWIFCK